MVSSVSFLNAEFLAQSQDANNRLIINSPECKPLREQRDISNFTQEDYAKVDEEFQKRYEERINEYFLNQIPKKILPMH